MDVDTMVAMRRARSQGRSGWAVRERAERRRIAQRVAQQVARNLERERRNYGRP